jgi:hypothetical protein
MPENIQLGILFAWLKLSFANIQAGLLNLYSSVKATEYRVSSSVTIEVFVVLAVYKRKTSRRSSALTTMVFEV